MKDTKNSLSKPRFTAKQGAYLSYIHQYRSLHGRAPSEAEMQRYFRVTPPTVHQMVMTLERLGLIERSPGVARSIRVLVAPDQPPTFDGPAQAGRQRSAQAADTIKPLDVALAFVARINAHDVDGIVELMTEDHVFIDALGERFEGRDTMRAAWGEFFRLFPGYAIKVQDGTFADGTVGLFGTASGSYADRPRKRWEVSGAWKAIITGARVAEWRVYGDTAWARG